MFTLITMLIANDLYPIIESNFPPRVNDLYSLCHWNAFQLFPIYVLFWISLGQCICIFFFPIVLQGALQHFSAWCEISPVCIAVGCHILSGALDWPPGVKIGLFAHIQLLLGYNGIPSTTQMWPHCCWLAFFSHWYLIFLYWGYVYLPYVPFLI